MIVSIISQRVIDIENKNKTAHLSCPLKSCGSQMTSKTLVCPKESREYTKKRRECPKPLWGIERGKI